MQGLPFHTFGRERWGWVLQKERKGGEGLTEWHSYSPHQSLGPSLEAIIAICCDWKKNCSGILHILGLKWRGGERE